MELAKHTCGSILLDAPIESLAATVNVNMTTSVKVTVNIYSPSASSVNVYPSGNVPVSAIIMTSNVSPGSLILTTYIAVSFIVIWNISGPCIIGGKLAFEERERNNTSSIFYTRLRS